VNHDDSDAFVCDHRLVRIGLARLLKSTFKSPTKSTTAGKGSRE
jgi:hypothetical protein